MRLSNVLLAVNGAFALSISGLTDLLAIQMQWDTAFTKSLAFIDTFLASTFPPKTLTDYEVAGHSLLKLHRNLISTRSISESEYDVAEYLAHYLKKAGFTVELEHVPLESPVGKPRYNVYAYLGKTRDTKVLLTSHIDTVPPFFPYSVDGTKIYGRGSCDAKASVVTQIFATLALIESGSINEGDVSLLYVVGEEKDGSGMRQASKHLNASWEYAVFGEPTELKLGVGHKGNYMFDLTVHGKASHSGYPELGISATEILIPVLNKLLTLEYPLSDLLGPSTLNIGHVEAGVAANVIPAFAKANIFIRVAADLEKIDELVKGVVEGVEHLEASYHVKLDPVSLDFDIPGFESIVLAYATDVPNLTSQEFKKRYLYGPGTIHVAHGADEHIENSDLLEAVEGYKKIIQHNLAQ